MKTVRLIALGPSATECPATKDGTEVWGIQYTWKHWKLDRAFVMDDQEWIVAKNHSFDSPIDIEQEMINAKVPIYTAKKWDTVPNTVEYPIEEIKKAFPHHYFMNSLSYMFALAIYEGFERIETYGIDLRYFNELGRLIWRPKTEMAWSEFMKQMPEWSYEEFMIYQHGWLDETICVAYWAGVAVGRGIEVVTTQRSSLMKPVYPGDTALYGYEVSPSIAKQRQAILMERKSLSEPQKVNVFRKPDGMSQEEFIKQIECGALQPHHEATMKTWEK